VNPSAYVLGHILLWVENIGRLAFSFLKDYRRGVDKYSPCKKVGTLANYILFTGIRRDKIRDMDNLFNDPDDVLFPIKPGIIPEEYLALTDEAQQKKDAVKFNYKALKRLSDADLAALRCKYVEGVPQRVLIDHEFKKREGKPARMIAIFGILVSVLIAVLTLYFKLK
jgi:hypothetical protein